MADDRKTGQYFDLLGEQSVNADASRLSRRNVAPDERFPDVDDILDRLTVNVRAAEKK